MKDKKIIVLAIIMGMLTLGMGGYIVYDKFIADKQLEGENSINSFVDLFGISDSDSFKYLSIKNNGDCYIHFNIDDEIGKELSNKYGIEYKILSNIKSATRVEYGNGGVETVVFIKNDGTLIALNPQSYMRSYRNNNYSIELITDFGSLTNIKEIKPYHSEIGTRILATDGNGIEYYIDIYLP